MPKYQATAYIRLSYTDDRSSESDSVTNQRKLIENFIERNPNVFDGYGQIVTAAFMGGVDVIRDGNKADPISVPFTAI